MALRKDLAQIAMIGVIAVALVGCRFKGVESANSASAPNQPLPYKGDPYTFGGIAEGSGGLVTTTTQTMETPKYEGAKFKKVAGPGAYTDPSGHKTAPAKPSDYIGDYQPPHRHEKGHGDEHGGEEHGSESGKDAGH